jgi:hypothetical protein
VPQTGATDYDKVLTRALTFEHVTQDCGDAAGDRTGKRLLVCAKRSSLQGHTKAPALDD